MESLQFSCSTTLLCNNEKKKDKPHTFIRFKMAEFCLDNKSRLGLISKTATMRSQLSFMKPNTKRLKKNQIKIKLVDQMTRDKLYSPIPT